MWSRRYKKWTTSTTPAIIFAINIEQTPKIIEFRCDLNFWYIKNKTAKFSFQAHLINLHSFFNFWKLRFRKLWAFLMQQTPQQFLQLIWDRFGFRTYQSNRLRNGYVFRLSVVCSISRDMYFRLLIRTLRWTTYLFFVCQTKLTSKFILKHSPCTIFGFVDQNRIRWTKPNVVAFRSVMDCFSCQIASLCINPYFNRSKHILSHLFDAQA